LASLERAGRGAVALDIVLYRS